MRVSRVFWPNEKCLIIRLIRRTAAPRRAFPEDQPRLVPRLRRTRRRTPTSRTARAAGDTRTCAAASSPRPGTSGCSTRAAARAPPELVPASLHAPAQVRARGGPRGQRRGDLGFLSGSPAAPSPYQSSRKRFSRVAVRCAAAAAATSAAAATAALSVQCRCACAGAPRHRRRRRPPQHGGVQPFPLFASAAAASSRSLAPSAASRSTPKPSCRQCPSSRFADTQSNKRFPRAQTPRPLGVLAPPAPARAVEVHHRRASRTPAAAARARATRCARRAS